MGDENQNQERDTQALEQDQWLSKFFPVPPPPRIVIGPMMDPKADVRKWYQLLIHRLADAHGYFSGTYEKVFTHMIYLPERTKTLSQGFLEVIYRLWDYPVDAHAMKWVFRLLPQDGLEWMQEELDALKESITLWQERYWLGRSLEGDLFTDFLALTSSIMSTLAFARALPTSAQELAEQSRTAVQDLHGLRTMITPPDAYSRQVEKLALQLEETEDPEAYAAAYEALLRKLFGEVQIRPVRDPYNPEDQCTVSGAVT